MPAGQRITAGSSQAAMLGLTADGEAERAGRTVIWEVVVPPGGAVRFYEPHPFGGGNIHYAVLLRGGNMLCAASPLAGVLSYGGRSSSCVILRPDAGGWCWEVAPPANWWQTPHSKELVGPGERDAVLAMMESARKVMTDRHRVELETTLGAVAAFRATGRAVCGRAGDRMRLSQVYEGGAFRLGDRVGVVVGREPEDRSTGLTRVVFRSGQSETFVWDGDNPEVEYLGEGQVWTQRVVVLPPGT